MQATTQEFDDELPDRPTSVSFQEARQEDAYWERTFWQERYYRSELGFEDYAPAYCVGYTGCAQYGGDFADAERSLCANWERIKGDSRLTLDEALPAMRAAWDRMARLRRRLTLVEGGRARVRRRAPSRAPVGQLAASTSSAAAVPAQ
jgi:hypothetical protein